MEDPVPYGNRPIQSFTVYKFEVNPVNPEISKVQSWKNLSSEAEYKKIIPSNYKPCHEVKVKSKDYYLVIHWKRWEDNICSYYTLNPQKVINNSSQNIVYKYSTQCLTAEKFHLF